MSIVALITRLVCTLKARFVSHQLSRGPQTGEAYDAVMSVCLFSEA